MSDDLAERIARAVQQSLSEGETFQCTRVWEAWIYGTMTDEDFTDASDGPLPGEITAAVMSVVAPAIRAAKAEAWDEGCEAFESAHRWDNAEPWGHLCDNPYRTTETGVSDEHR